jgi:transcriptional regulator with XRE-family HTH domain
MPYSTCRQMSVVKMSTYSHICNMDIRKKVGKKLKKLRLERGLSQESLANIAELDRTYIPSIEKGERNISVTVLEKLANALKISIKDFFDE